LRQNVRFAPDDAVRLAVEAIELEVDVHLERIEFGHKGGVIGDALAIRVEHYGADIALFCGPKHGKYFGMNGGFAPGELHDLRTSFRGYKVVEYLFDFRER